MKENRDHHEGSNNTGMIIAAVIAVLLVIGLIAYFVMGNNNVEDAIDDVKDTTENIIDNDNETKTMSDVAGSYQAKIGDSAGVDEDTGADEDNYIELVLREDGTASLVMTADSKDVITGSYTISNNMIRISGDNKTTETTNQDGTTVENTTDNNMQANSQTYTFTINADNTLGYMSGNDNVTLSKVEKTTLKYIK
ncbi:MAG: hypothetical protein IKE75_04130 [Bacilli bacterium]|nr:hypothetical protein [Bacilli bacterium]